MKDTIGLRIKKKREENGITQKELADRLNISFQAISKWEQGKSVPDIVMLEPLSKELDESIDWIITGKYFAKAKQLTPEESTLKYFCEVIRPVEATEQMRRKIIKMVVDYGEEETKNSIDIAYDAYVAKKLENKEKEQGVKTMVDKISGIAFNRSLPPVEGKTNLILQRFASVFGKRNSFILKDDITHILKYFKEEEKKLEILENIEKVSKKSIYAWNVLDYTKELRWNLDEAKRMSLGYLKISKELSEDIRKELICINDQIKKKECLGAITKTVKQALDKMLREFLPYADDYKDYFNENGEIVCLTEIADKIYSSFGRNIGKYTANRIKDFANCEITKLSELDMFNSLLNELSTKSKRIKSLYENKK